MPIPQTGQVEDISNAHPAKLSPSNTVDFKIDLRTQGCLMHYQTTPGGSYRPVNQRTSPCLDELAPGHQYTQNAATLVPKMVQNRNWHRPY